MQFGLPITIEHPKGSTRTGTGADGKTWARKMHADYGHIRHTEGTDGDELDVYVGPDAKADVVFAVTQLKTPDFKKFDEQKFMLGFPTAAEAKTCYLKHYPNPKIFGGMTAMTLDDFKAKAMTKKNHGKKLASHDRLYVEMNLHLLAQGEEKVSAHVMGGPAAAGMAAQFAAERGVASPYVADLGGGADFMQYPRPHGGGLALHSRTGSGATFKAAGAQVAGRPLTVADRSKIKEKNFALPEQRKYPIHDVSHARAALSMVAKHGTPEEQSRVRAAVAKKWPGIATSAPKEKQAGDRTGKIEDRLDDVGLTILGAPYAAKGIANVLKNRPGRLGAIGRAADAAHNAMHQHENAMELTGLALVAPGVIKPMARGINKALPKEKPEAPKVAGLDALSDAQLTALEKVAAQYVPDFEYMTEAEKLATLASMAGTLVGKTQSLGRRVVGGAQRLGSGLRTGAANLAKDYRTAVADIRHGDSIRGIQRARDFRVGLNRGAGTAVQAPQKSIVASVNARVQRIAEQRQALAQFRADKGLGTSAERATANRAAKAPVAAPAAQPQTPTTPSTSPNTAVHGAASNAAPAAQGAANVRAPAAPAAAQTAHDAREAELTGAFGTGPELPAVVSRESEMARRQSGNAAPVVPAAPAAPAAAQAPAQNGPLPKNNVAQIPAQQPAAQQAANPAAQQAANPAAQQEMGIIDSLHSYLPQGTPRWVVPTALAGAGGLAAGAMLFGGGQKQGSITLEQKTAALKIAAGYARPGQGFISRIFRGAKPNVAPAASSALSNVRPDAAAANAVGSTAMPAAAESVVEHGGQQAAQAAGPLLSGKTIAKGALIGTVGLGLYGGKKVIDTAANMAGGHRHITPAATPDYGSVVL